MAKFVEYLLRFLAALILIPAFLKQFFMSEFTKKCLRKLPEKYKQKPCEYWETATFPITYERDFEGKEIQVKLDLLESEPEYLQIGLMAYSQKRFSLWPFSTSAVGKTFIINKPTNCPPK
jgi:hypothetical protein